MARPIGFSAFLKLLELSDQTRRTELKKKLGGGGGFQYWRPIQIVAPKIILPSANIEALTAELEGLCSGYQRTYNKNALVNFIKWREGKQIEPATLPPMIEVPFGNSGLTIRLKPDLAFRLDGVLHSASLWATTKPMLSIETLSIGLFFLAAAYKTNGQGHYRHAIVDTVTNRFFDEAQIASSAIHKLKDKVDAFKKDWTLLNPTPPQPPEAPSEDQPQLPK